MNTTYCEEVRVLLPVSPGWDSMETMLFTKHHGLEKMGGSSLEGGTWQRGSLAPPSWL